MLYLSLLPFRKLTIMDMLPFSLKKCPNLKIYRPDFKLYKSCSRAFKNICKSYSLTMEEFSIDECFLDMTGIVSDFSRAVNLAHEIKDRIKNELRSTVNMVNSHVSTRNTLLSTYIFFSVFNI